MLDAYVSPTTPPAGPKVTQVLETPVLFPNVAQLSNLFQIKFQRLERDETKFLSDPKVLEAISHIATQDKYRGPYELGEQEKFFYVVKHAELGDNECLQGCFGSRRRMDGSRVCGTCLRKKQLTARHQFRKQQSLESGVDRTSARSRVTFKNLSPQSKSDRLDNVALSRKSTIDTCRRLRLELHKNLTLDREKDVNVIDVLKEAFLSADTRKEIQHELVRLAVGEKTGTHYPRSNWQRSQNTASRLPKPYKISDWFWLEMHSKFALAVASCK